MAGKDLSGAQRRNLRAAQGLPKYSESDLASRKRYNERRRERYQHDEEYRKQRQASEERRRRAAKENAPAQPHKAKPSREERFWSLIDRSGGIDACWIWTASLRTTGYGQFYYEETVQAAHRVAWKIVNGSIPDGLYVLHKCDNPVCCNPTHLFVGTPKDNVEDMMRKGRHATQKRAAGS